MCGLFGIAGDLRFQDEGTFKTLALANYFRGPDAAGLAAIRTNGDAVIAKLPSNPIDLFHHSNFKAALNGNTSRVFLGHTRLKTRGDNVTANAHPFHVDHIVGAHNGTLEFSSWRALEKELGEEFAVDSLALITAIAKLGIVKTMKLCEEGKDQQTGAWAITWVDQKEGTLNFLRNKHRPLFYMYERPEKKEDKGYRRMLWSSDWYAIRTAVETAIPTYHVLTDKDNVGYFMFQPDVWHQYDIEELCVEKTKPIKPKTKTVKGTFVPPKPEYTNSQYGNKSANPFGRPQNICGFQRGGSQLDEETDGIHTTTVGTPNSHQKTGYSPSTAILTTTYRGKEKKKVVVDLVGCELSPYAGVITKDDFQYMAEAGCFFCGAPVDFGDVGVTIFQRDQTVLCRKCSDHPDDKENPPVRIYLRASAFDAIAN